MFDGNSRFSAKSVPFVLAALIVMGLSLTQVSAQTSEQALPNIGHQVDARVRVVQVPHAGFVPDAEVDTLGDVHLAYVAEDNVYYVKSSDEGRSFGNPIRVNTEADFAFGAAYRGPDLAVGKDDRIHVVWYNAAYQKKRPKHEWGVSYSRLSTSGVDFEPTRNLNHKPSDNFSIAADKNGKVAVIWMAESAFASLSDDGGDHFSPALDLKTDPCECCGSRAIYTDDASLSVLFRDKADNDRDTYLALLPSDARSFAHVKVSQAVWNIDSCPMTGSFLSRAESGLVAGWETKSQIYYARLDKRGRKTSAGEIHVADRGRYPVVLTASDGVTLVAWKNDSTLEWQLFDPNDKPMGRRASAVGNTRDRPAGVVTKNGTFLLFP